MKRFIIHLMVALITFSIGLIAAYLTNYIHSPRVEVNAITVELPGMLLLRLSNAMEGLQSLNPEESKIVAEAESFVCSNGYTEQQCGIIGRVYFEPGDSLDSLNEIWTRRHDTLEGKAYGIILKEKKGSKFWTVVFRYTNRTGKNREKVGRAWTVEENRFNKYFIRFGHDFPLAKVERKL
jgi:hypothetical protein